MTRKFLERPENRRNLHDTIELVSGKDMQIKFIDTKPKGEDNIAEGFEAFANNTDIPFNVV